MSDIHRRTFELLQDGVDRGTPMRELRAELQDHLSSCPECRMDIEIDQELRAEAALRWSAALEPKRPVGETLVAMRAAVDRKGLQQVIFIPLQVVAWIALAILFILVLNWAIANVQPQPATTPEPTDVKQVTPPTQGITPTPEPGELELPKTPLEPFATGAELLGRGLWSPDSKRFFFDLVQASEDPRSDRRVTTASFLDPESGEICQSDQEYLGPVGLSSQARWLPDGRLLIFAEDEGVQILTPCGETVSLNDHFSEPILSIPMQEYAEQYILLQGESQYWLLNSQTLDARPLEGFLPSMEDRQAWSPSSEQLAIYQPGTGDPPGQGQLTLLDAGSGEVLRTVELPPYSEMLLLQWLRDDTLYMYTFSENSPTLVDLSESEPQIIKVLPELFGLNLVYPDEFSSDTAVADPSTGTYHIAFKVNTDDDKATYLYHSETGQVERLSVEGHTYLVFPNGDLEPLPSAQDELAYIDEFDLVWVDDAEKDIQHLSVTGHTPRSDPFLWPRWIPGRQEIAFASSQGVSLVSIFSGQILGFWSLEGGGDANRPMASPDGRFVVVSTSRLSEDQSSSSGAYYLIPVGP
jgi:Tol biopolymer transport system component